jgi:D-alanyl-D-alanine carboxypeptidase
VGEVLTDPRVAGTASLRPIVCLCLLLAVPPHLPAQASLAPLNEVEGSQVDQAVRTIMDRDNVPAVSLAIVRRGSIAYLKAYGHAKLATVMDRVNAAPRPRIATVTTRFAIGSVSKEFTAAAILVLADRGKLSLDDTVSKYLPA